MAIRDDLMRRDLALTPSEEKIVRLLLTDYPGAGLGSASSLARRAGVSDPTVVRLAVKLGFEGFPDFQRHLLAEVEAKLQSPLLMMEAKKPNVDEVSLEGPAIAYMRSVADCIDKALMTTPSATYENAARAVMETKGRVYLLGGRYSRYVAGMLAGYLAQLRPNTMHVEALSAQEFDLLIDLGKRDLLIVFDYRRYQFDVIEFASRAARRGVRILLFTDPWLSPIAEHAEVTLVCPLEVRSPYDTMAPAVAQIEAFIAHILSSMTERTRKRIEELESIRREASVTFDNALAPATDEAGQAAPGSIEISSRTSNSEQN